MKRFPVTVCYVVALSVYLAYLVETNAEGDRKWLLVWGYFFSVGTLLSLTLHLWTEERKSGAKKIIIHVVANALLLADTLFLYNLTSEQSYIEISIAHGAAILALGISIFFLSFTKEKNDIPSWNFAMHTITSFIIAQIVGYIMSGGISLLVFSLHKLFDVDVNGKCYMYILILFSVLLPMLLFLGMLPQGEEKHDRQPQSQNFLNGTIHYLFLPLLGGYLLVLYLYAARILSNWELPAGWVSWLVVTLMAGCIAIEFGLYPTRIRDGRRIDEWIARWMPALVLPLLMLMTVGIVRRFNDYGVTINRLYLITVNIWFYIVCIGLIFTKARRINWIPVSFAAIFLLTSVLPVNYASITRDILLKNVKTELEQTCDMPLPLSHKAYNAWLASLPEKKALEVNDKFLYLNDLFGGQVLVGLVEKNVSFHTAQYQDDKSSGKHSGKELQSYYGQINPRESILVPKGYNRFISIQHKFSYFPHKYVETGILPVSLGHYTGEEKDTVYIDLKTLKELARKGQNVISPTRFKCNSGDMLFVLDNFSVKYYEAGPEDLTLNMSGYLFKK